MTNNTDENQEEENANQNQDVAIAVTPGQRLKERREELGYCREHVAESLYITVHYVTALENDQYDKLPGPTFVKGYFKSYAGFLGVDVADVVALYEEHSGDKGSSVEKVQAIPNLEKAQRNRAIVIIIVTLIVVAALGWWVADMALADAGATADINWRQNR